MIKYKFYKDADSNIYLYLKRIEQRVGMSTKFVDLCLDKKGLFIDGDDFIKNLTPIHSSKITGLQAVGFLDIEGIRLKSDSYCSDEVYYNEKNELTNTYRFPDPYGRSKHSTYKTTRKAITDSKNKWDVLVDLSWGIK